MPAVISGTDSSRSGVLSLSSCPAKGSSSSKISEVVKNNSSHFLRHSRAIYNLKILGMDIRTLQKFMRHKSINSTMIYTDSSDKEVDNINVSYVF